jgi:thiol:disulfide interchange protein DsbG
MNTTRRLALLSLPLVLAAGLAACSREAAPPAGEPAAQAIPKAQAVEAVAARGKGFDAGTLMSNQVVYVLFDPQCPHCAHLWEAAQPLMARVRFVWIPVAFLGPRSLPQGAAILQAPAPAEAMAAHERSLLEGGGGTSASASVPDEIRQAIEANTRLLAELGADAVPFIVTRHRQSGDVIAQAGAMDTAALARLIGL